MGVDSRYVTDETRAESHSSIDKSRRYTQILEILLHNKELTAKEIAVEMHNRGYADTEERNLSAPRLTELCRLGVVDVVGKRYCRWTGKQVAVYRMK